VFFTSTLIFTLIKKRLRVKKTRRRKAIKNDAVLGRNYGRGPPAVFGAL
jgi:hypothetical protein